MKVLITGASGLLGGDIAEFLDMSYDVIPVYGRKDLQISDAKAVKDLLAEKRPDIVIHSAAWRDIDRCELEPREAFVVNCLGTQHVVNGAEAIGARVVYISSDAVFDGHKMGRYLEYDDTTPLNFYGETKLAGEEITRALTNKHLILRVPFLFGHRGKRVENNILGLVDKALAGKEIVATCDQVASPTYTYHVASVLDKLLAEEVYGTFHISNRGTVSRHGFALKALELLNIDSSNLKFIPYLQGGKEARRQHYIEMDTISIENALGIKMETWKNALEECLDNMKNRGELDL